MSLAATCWWTLARTIVLCLLAWPVCRLLERAASQLSPSWRLWFTIGLLAPCCFPELLVGYAFRDLALAHPRWAELLCSGLLFVRMVPVGTIALLAAPQATLDAASIHCRRLLKSSRKRARSQIFELVRCYWYGPITRSLPALAIMSLIAFQEFEMAALLQTMSWTDWFVAAQRLGLERSEMLRQALWPLLWQLPVLVGVLYWLQFSPRDENCLRVNAENWEAPIRPNTVRWAIAFVAVCLVVGCLIPVGMISWRTFEGLSMFFRHRLQLWGMAREIATSSAVAVCAGLSAWAISGQLKGLALNSLLFGLFGSLLLSLGCVALFQFPVLRPLYDTPLPWLLALTLWLLPRAAMLRLWLRILRNDEAIHVAQMIPVVKGQSSRPALLLWYLRDQPACLMAGLLCYWAYCDLPTAYMLAPTGMASGLVRLYNFMHFGRSAALSAEATVFFGLPILAASLVLLISRKLRFEISNR